MRDFQFILKPRYSTSHALVIGINNYAKASPLAYAVNDAEEMRSVLISELNFTQENITLLRDGEATREKILRCYLQFAGEHVNVDDRIFVFFAGHGHTRRGYRGEVGYLVPFDADPSDAATLLRWDDLTRNAEMIRAKHMLFIMDACYGGLALKRKLSVGSARFLKDMMRRYSRQVLTAGKADEVVADSGGPIPNHSVFTGHLIEGIRGKATGNEGVLTANGLMSYVYGQVANDDNSHQTPHYGYFDGDGDFILRAPQLEELAADEAKEDADLLIVVPSTQEEPNELTSGEKVNHAKRLLSSDESTIELHDFMVGEIRSFLANVSEDQFTPQGQFSKSELLERLAKYERAVNDLSRLITCLSYWSKPTQLALLQKAFCRSVDHLENKGGLTVWLNLRWYPIIIEFYCAGIAAVAARRFDSLATTFLAPTGLLDSPEKESSLAQAVVRAIGDLNGQEIFKQLPEHENYYTPLSEYLFKFLQPRLDDLLFLGKGYERAFDEFEVLFCLAGIDLRKQQGLTPWALIGRFGWKRRRHSDSPFARILEEIKEARERWPPLIAGLFGGRIARLDEAVAILQERLGRLEWF